MQISDKAVEIIENAKLFHDQEKTKELIEKHGIDAAAEAIVVLSHILPQRGNVPYISKRE